MNPLNPDINTPQENNAAKAIRPTWPHRLTCDGVLLGLLFIGLLGFFRHYIQRLAFGDDLYVVWNLSHCLLEGDFRGPESHNFLNADPGHPWLFYALIAAGWRVFGVVPQWPHLLTFFSAAVALLYAFKLARYWSGGDKSAGGVAMLLLVVNPLFGMTAVGIHLNMPLTAATAGAVYYLARGKGAKLAACLAIMALMKAYGVVMAFALFVPFAILQLMALKRGQISIKPACVSVWPFLAAPGAFALSCLVRFAFTGNWLSSPVFDVDRQMTPAGSLGQYLANLKVIGWERFIGNNELLWIIIGTLAITLAQYLARHRQRPLTDAHPSSGPFATLPEFFQFIAVLWFPMLFMVLFFALRSEGNLANYLLPWYPAMMAIVAVALWGLRGWGRQFAIVAVAVICMFNLVRWHWGWMDRVADVHGEFSHYLKRTCLPNFDVPDFAKTLERTAKWVDENHPGAVIAASYPEEMAFKHKWAGFVNHPYQTVTEYRGDGKFNVQQPLDNGASVLYLYSGYAHQRPPIELEEAFGATRIKTHESNTFHYHVQVWLMEPQGAAREGDVKE